MVGHTSNLILLHIFYERQSPHSSIECPLSWIQIKIMVGTVILP